MARVILLGLIISLPANAQLPKSVNTLLIKYQIPQSSVSAIVVPVLDKQPVLEHYSKTPHNPASVMKLLTTFAALDILGPAHNWATQYYLNGHLNEGGVLEGDLIIKGGGDPYLVKEQFWLHLANLRELGIKTITGNLLIDNTAFDLPVHDNGEFDQKPTRLYNVGPAATIANFNASRFRLQPAAGRINILHDPPMHNVVINNQLKPAKGRCHGAQSGWSMNLAHKKGKAYVAFTGQYKTQCGSYDLRRSVLDTEAYLHGLFTYLWRSIGGKFSGGYALVEVKDEAQPFFTGGSKTLVEVISGTNKFSNNLLARQLLLAIAHNYFGQGSTVQDGIESIRSWLKANNLHMPELEMENGAGLSRQILLTAESLAKLLVLAAKSQYAPEFMASFSLSGTDGTMKKRLKNMALSGRARLKTGYLSGVRSMAGYIQANNGQSYAVVLMIQDPKVNFSNGNEIQDAFIRWVLKVG